MFYRVFLLLLVINSQIALSAVMVKKNLWPQNSQLNIVFLDGSEKLKSLVKTYSILWVKGSNLSLYFYSSLNNAPKNKHIRISFEHHTGSQLGNQKDNLSINPTMNLFALNSDQISDSGAKRLILHEFGHALGFEHEFRNPNWPYGQGAMTEILKECLPKMIFIGYSKNSALEHCLSISSKLDPKNILSTAYDESSIMNYALSFDNKNNSRINIKAQTVLSYLDRYAIQKWYPSN